MTSVSRLAPRGGIGAVWLDAISPGSAHATAADQAYRVTLLIDDPGAFAAGKHAGVITRQRIVPHFIFPQTLDKPPVSER